MEQNWQGPYEVVEKVGDGNYQLRKGSKATYYEDHIQQQQAETLPGEDTKCP